MFINTVDIEKGRTKGPKLAGILTVNFGHIVKSKLISKSRIIEDISLVVHSISPSNQTGTTDYLLLNVKKKQIVGEE